MSRIGLLAGSGDLPLVFARAAKANGETVIALGIKGVTDPELEGCVDRMHWFSWGSLGKALLVLPVERIGKVIMLGKVKKDSFFKGDEAMDEEAMKVLSKVKDRKDYSILRGVSDLLGKFGVEVMSSVTYLDELLPSKGVLTARRPSREESEDIEYGLTAAKELSKFDIGQTVVVKDKTVVALEAVEGTDETIKRAGILSKGKGGFVVVKVSRPDQDMRFDVPLVGPETVQAVIGAGGKVLAIEEKKTILMDREAAVKLADSGGISIVVI